MKRRTPNYKTLTLYTGDCLNMLFAMPYESAQLIVTSPPYNLGKSYETRKPLDAWIAEQTAVIHQCVRVLRPEGSLCWQVGNYVQDGEIVPLDIPLHAICAGTGLYYHNRIIWHFGHGLHCTNRLSGRYETINWFTKAPKGYTFNLDPIRVPQKYPGKKYFKGPKAGQYSCNPKGKNPGDVWDIPNVKHNHVEKTEHPCQFPVELVERLVLSLTDKGDLVVDPFMGVGSTGVAAVMHGRRFAGADIMPQYVSIAKKRINLAAGGRLKTRPMNKPIHRPSTGVSIQAGPRPEGQ